jgi:hypothetical protein
MPEYDKYDEYGWKADEDEQPWPEETYCDYCDSYGHTFRSCAKRDEGEFQ